MVAVVPKATKKSPLKGRVTKKNLKTKPRSIDISKKAVIGNENVNLLNNESIVKNSEKKEVPDKVKKEDEMKLNETNSNSDRDSITGNKSDIKRNHVNRSPKDFNVKNKSTLKNVKQMINENDRRKLVQNSRSLYIRFAPDCYPESLKKVYSIHPEIKSVRVTRQAKRTVGETTNDQSLTLSYCFVEFESAEICETVRTKIKGETFFGGPIFVDSMIRGEAKQNKKKILNFTRLVVSGSEQISKVLNSSNVQKFFPKCSSLTVPSTPTSKAFVFLNFVNADDARETFEASHDLKIKGVPVLVSFARVRHRRLSKKKKEQRTNQKKRKQNKDEVVTSENVEKVEEFENDVSTDDER